MLQHFKWAIIVAIVGNIIAYFWGEHKVCGSGFSTLFIVFILSILEISLSFDNAVVNAVRLEKMTPKWQKRFLTWGILVAVFGMRILFPVLIVSIFSRIDLITTFKMAFANPDLYTYHLHLIHSSILTFGGIFLFMLFLHYIFNENKKIHWIKPLENYLSHLGHIEGLETVLSIFAIYLVQHFAKSSGDKLAIMLSGLCGIGLYILIHGLSEFMQKHAPDSEQGENFINTSFKAGFINFMYLELIDASFSLDGVLGAFALSKDIVIIAIGLAIGAMFVRSLTVMLVEQKTLKQFIYLEHGAHWAIGCLAVIMLISTKFEISEMVTGLIGFIFILLAFISSVIHNKRTN